MFTVATFFCCFAFVSPDNSASAPLLVAQHAIDEHAADSHGEPNVMSEHSSQRQSFFGWLFQSLGMKYALLLPLSGFVIFLGAVLALAFTRPAVIASYLVLLPLPLLIGIFGTIEGLITSMQVVSLAGRAEPSILAEILSSSLATTLMGFLINMPAYFVIAIGLPLRVFFSARNASPRC